MAGDSKFTLKQIGNYKFAGKTLGKGNFARVELAEHRLTGAKVLLFNSLCGRLITRGWQEKLKTQQKILTTKALCLIIIRVVRYNRF